jgi:hypothetical protein
MIVNWTKDGIKVIPIPGKETNIVLAPGFNEVDDLEWISARPYVLKQIEDKVIEENWNRVVKALASKSPVIMSVDMQPIGIDDVGNNGCFIPSTIKDIQARTAVKVIMKTYDKRTLDKWSELEQRDEVRTMIRYQRLWIDDPNKAQEMFGSKYGHGDSKE